MSDATACYVDADGCLVCPERPAVAGIPARIENRAVLGWNAGANSMDVIDGDLHAVFTVPVGVRGVIMGLKGDRERVTVPALVEHGLYFQRSGAIDVVQVIERGSTRTVPVVREGTETFEIRRTGSQVNYLINGAPFYQSNMPSSGPKVLNACLYATGDALPSSAAGA